MEVVASLSQGRTAAAQCGLFTHKSVSVIFEPPCIKNYTNCEMLKISFEVEDILRLKEESLIRMEYLAKLWSRVSGV